MISYLQSSLLIEQLPLMLKVFGALILGALIGWEREKVGKEAGIRTFGFIAAGACVFSLLSMSLSFADPSRIISMVVTGIGFIGGGVIFLSNKERGLSSHGLTTASSLWATTTIGLMVGFELYIVAVAVTLLVIITLHLPSSKVWLLLSKKQPKNHK